MERESFRPSGPRSGPAGLGSVPLDRVDEPELGAGVERFCRGELSAEGGDGPGAPGGGEGVEADVELLANDLEVA